MSEIEKRARELLATQYKELGVELQAAALMIQGHQPGGVHYAAVRAIIAALTPPEGYVLAPVEPTEAMQRVGAAVACTDVIEIQQMWSAMLAARPEVII